MGYWYYKDKQKGASPCSDKYCDHWLASNRNPCKAVRSCACNICQEWEGIIFTQITPGGYILGGVYDDCLFACQDNPNMTRDEFVAMAIQYGSLSPDLEPIPPGLANNELFNQALGDIATGENDLLLAVLTIILLFIILYIYLDG